MFMESKMQEIWQFYKNVYFPKTGKPIDRSKHSSNLKNTVYCLRP